jgi:lauroyl/myristoyl acyltransferase
VTVFGDQREFLTGTVQVAMRCRATVVQAFVVSRRNFYYRLIVKPPLHVPAEDVEAPPLPELMQRYADGIADHVREHPDHLSRV